MPTKQIPDLEWKFEEEVQLVEPVLVQIYHLPEQSATTENDRPERQQLVEAEKTKSQDTRTSQEDRRVATTENDRPDRSPTEVQRLLTTTESDCPERLQLVEAEKTENQDTKTGQEDQEVVTTENDRPDRSPTEVQRLLTTTESDRPERLQLVEAEKTVNQDTKTGQEDQGVATIETDRAVRSQMTASENSALKILETLIFLLISLATVAVLF